MNDRHRPTDSAADVAVYRDLIAHAASYAAQSEKLVAVANGLAQGTVDFDTARAYADAAAELAVEAPSVLQAKHRALTPEPKPATEAIGVPA